MIRRATVSTAVVAVLALSASTAAAQSANIQALANVFTAISVSGTRDLDFGNVFPGIAKTVVPSAGTSGLFSATGQASTNVNMTFTLPTDLSSGANLLPIGTWTGCFDTDNDPSAGCTGFTPSAVASAASFSGAGALFVFVGGTVTPGAGQASGAYTGTIVIQLDYF